MHNVIGLVRLPTGAPVESVNVLHKTLPTQTSANTNDTGYFSIANLCLGDALIFTKEGYITVETEITSLDQTVIIQAIGKHLSYRLAICYQSLSDVSLELFSI